MIDTIHEALEVERLMADRFASVIRVSLFDCTNAVYVGTDRPLDARGLRGAIRRDPVLRDALGNLTFRTRGGRLQPLR